jgi:hypothetical protein
VELRRSSLCPRCGGVVEFPDLGTCGEAACPECGLGFSTGSVFAAAQRNPLRRWRARRRGATAGRDHAAQRRDVVRQLEFPVYGLDASWTGRRWVGGWGASGDVVDRIDLAHGDAYDAAAPLVRIETRALRVGEKDLQEGFAAKGLAQHLWHEGVDHEALRPAFTSADPTATWAALTLPVDGEPTAFRLLGAGGSWVALGRVDRRLVAIQGRHVDPASLALVTVEDVEPYLSDDGLPG